MVLPLPGIRNFGLLTLFLFEQLITKLLCLNRVILVVGSRRIFLLDLVRETK